MTIKKYFCMLCFIFSFSYINSLADSISIGNVSYIEYITTKYYSNIPVVYIILQKSKVIIEQQWKNKKKNSIMLYYNISSVPWEDSYNLNFINNFNNMFKIVEKDSFWIPFNSNEKKTLTFLDDGDEKNDKNIALSIKNNIVNFSVKHIPKLSSKEEYGGILALALNLTDKFKFNEIFKNKFLYEYENNYDEIIDDLSIAPDLIISTNNGSEVSIIKYQSLDSNNDNIPDFPYQIISLKGNPEDIIYYKVKITNKSNDTIYNLKTTSYIADFSKMSYGDKGYTGTGFPILQTASNEIIRLTDYPKEGHSGVVRAFIDKLDSNQSIYLYYCVKIIR